MSRRRIAGVIVCALAMTSVIALPPAANATDCAVGKSCFWRDIGYDTGGCTACRISFEFKDVNFGNNTYPGTTTSGANSASSVSNEGSVERSYWYANTSCTTLGFSLAVNTGDGDLTDSSGHAPGGYNNTLESGAFDSSRASC